MDLERHRAMNKAIRELAKEKPINDPMNEIGMTMGAFSSHFQRAMQREAVERLVVSTAIAKNTHESLTLYSPAEWFRRLAKRVERDLKALCRPRGEIVEFPVEASDD
jgi:hypothetical protein